MTLLGVFGWVLSIHTEYATHAQLPMLAVQQQTLVTETEATTMIVTLDDSVSLIGQYLSLTLTSHCSVNSQNVMWLSV
jgi:hypothetical protein